MQMEVESNNQQPGNFLCLATSSKNGILSINVALCQQLFGVQNNSSTPSLSIVGLILDPNNGNEDSLLMREMLSHLRDDGQETQLEFYEQFDNDLSEFKSNKTDPMLVAWSGELWVKKGSSSRIRVYILDIIGTFQDGMKDPNYIALAGLSLVMSSSVVVMIDEDLKMDYIRNFVPLLAQGLRSEQFDHYKQINLLIHKVKSTRQKGNNSPHSLLDFSKSRINDDPMSKILDLFNVFNCHKVPAPQLGNEVLRKNLLQNFLSSIFDSSISIKYFHNGASMKGENIIEKMAKHRDIVANSNCQTLIKPEHNLRKEEENDGSGLVEVNKEDDDKIILLSAMEKYLKEYNSEIEKEASSALTLGLLEGAHKQSIAKVVKNFRKEFSGSTLYAQFEQKLVSELAIIGDKAISKFKTNLAPTRSSLTFVTPSVAPRPRMTDKRTLFSVQKDLTVETVSIRVHFGIDKLSMSYWDDNKNATVKLLDNVDNILSYAGNEFKIGRHQQNCVNAGHVFVNNNVSLQLWPENMKLTECSIILIMLLTLKRYAETNLSRKVSNCVLVIPSFIDCESYSGISRFSTLLNFKISVISESDAVAIQYFGRVGISHLSNILHSLVVIVLRKSSFEMASFSSSGGKIYRQGFQSSKKSD
ncbi:uncharacterized protein LOC118439486 [Folsomia candida]|uniref:uncharacterized protein LOC118439486 n=1 Tax=Folsomia candida TaxID=158441 RepID=UPI001604AE1C|nr:uncharacterized protein LOC118439486 [Folsomia candida]